MCAYDIYNITNSRYFTWNSFLSAGPNCVLFASLLLRTTHVTTYTRMFANTVKLYLYYKIVLSST